MNTYFFRKSSSTGYPDGNQMVWFLIAVNVAMYLLFAPPGSANRAMLTLYCTPEYFRFYQLLSAGFIHGNFGHILFNMWGLYLFGTLVAPHIGKWNFLWLYLIGVLTGNLIFLGVNWGSGGGLLGASGAVCAVMVAAAMFEPRRQFTLLFFPFAPIRTTTLVICYTVLEIFFELSGADAGVAHLAHLGGFLGGYLFIRIAFGGRAAWDPFRRLLKGAPRPSAEGFTWAPPPPRQPRSAPPSGAVSSQELDALLDKVSREGINALSEYELQRLRQAREQMRGR